MACVVLLCADALSANDVPDLQLRIELDVLREMLRGHAEASGDYEHGRRFGPDSFDDPSGQPVVEEGRVEHCALCCRGHVVAREDGVVATRVAGNLVERLYHVLFRHVSVWREPILREELHGVVETPDLPADAQAKHFGVDHAVRNSRHAAIRLVDGDHRFEPCVGVRALAGVDHLLDAADGIHVFAEDCGSRQFHDEPRGKVVPPKISRERHFFQYFQKTIHGPTLEERAVACVGDVVRSGDRMEGSDDGFLGDRGTPIEHSVLQKVRCPPERHHFPFDIRRGVALDTGRYLLTLGNVAGGEPVDHVENAIDRATQSSCVFSFLGFEDRGQTAVRAFGGAHDRLGRTIVGRHRSSENGEKPTIKSVFRLHSVLSMANEMAKAYEAKLVEDGIYESWLSSGYFAPEGLPNITDSTEAFTVVMPPPNVTGVLHLGHALENSLMDAMVRYQRLLGKKVLLVPGTDHAAIATQARVEKNLMAGGMKNPRQELGREGLLEKIREFAESSKSTILTQVKKLGTSADWSRLAYTFDDKRSAAVNELFTRMYNDGLIYRGFRVVNWSVKGQSTCSDDEIETIERESMLYTFKYSKDFPITISTTRPETKVGDTAVAVHPTDDRYKTFVGKTYDVEFASAKLSIKVIASDAVDPSFGTGALGVTPAHSAIDFGMYEVQKAKNDPIEIKQVIGADGKMTADAGSVAGMTIEAARERVVSWLKEQGLLEKEEKVIQNVGTSDRYGDVIEAIPMTQWWLNVNKEIPGRGKTLRDLMREAVTTGLDGKSEQKVSITPDRFTKLYLDRIENLRDWCLSRQLWWGHRIPAWYRKTKSLPLSEGELEGVEIFVGAKPEGEGWVQDEDTLDTWFSSGSWTFSTLGWPSFAKATDGKPSDLEQFHPTNWIQMGYEILYLWLMRMILMSTYALNQIPFKDAYIHGILRDKDGKKFSKSSGNGIDPIEVIEEYGCDALRVSLLSGNTPGNDSRYYIEKVEASRNLVNKLWNISRFILSAKTPPPYEGGGRGVVEPKTLADKWILARFSETAKKVSLLIDRYDFSLAIEVLRDFTWNDFADWYLEIAKIEGEKSDILLYILERLLILWHPFAPFVTEEIYKNFDSGMIIVAKWPTVEHELSSEDRAAFDQVCSAVIAIRNYLSEHKTLPKDVESITIVNAGALAEMESVIGGLTKVKIVRSSMERPESITPIVVGAAQIFVQLPAVDAASEKIRIESEIAEATKFIAAQESKLANTDFVARAPEKVIAGERQKLADLQEKLAALQKEHAALVS